ncbi:MAG: NAD(P)-dependent glycerol-3-phosphate dehydrogenase [Thaumarchaeota archaeon]|nr:NAD(P)-dependent glycerol-3-phosphate dehydrogenase [Nitrososphaerota archaeon]
MIVSILGGGSWGTALAVHLARKGFQINVWEFFDEQAREMQEQRICKLLPGVRLLENIFVSSRMSDVLKSVDVVLLVVPSDKVVATIRNAAPLLQEQPIVICSKGFSADGRLLSDVVALEVSGEVYCLYGPTHAEEVGRGKFSGIVLAGRGARKGELHQLFQSDVLKVDVCEDIIGVQVCAALKNVLAVFVGVLDGMQLGDNAKAYVMTKGLEEIKQVGLKLGAVTETFSGLAGMGDTIVTCTSLHSRNRFVGQEVGKGRKLDEVLKEMTMVAEGVTAVQIAVKLQEKFQINLPLIYGLYEVLFDGKDPRDVLRGL